ncbi:DNA polymerase IV [Sphingobium algorifonticola]|uniref:DNA polymerase IV n=1 Tax=Sphingobium algorifonticola TaxID=2008318 RepID=A0A437J3E1_9SPHN|nr:DNA polymerase IV [Sphingobium algorifonticola]RVT38895.1 DNA polymerase IV [Sphingobium algorifonticola]
MDPRDTPLRKIIHIDMDAFFASVEQRDHPELRGRPVVVGGGGARGVVAAASYEARAFGVRSAMPGAKARRLCPDLIFVPHRFDVYRAVSRQIREIFARYTDVIQPLSLDEAYLDVTANRPGIASATQIAQEIRAAIRTETGLTASAGVSYNKLIAKLASDENKPDGLCVIRPEQGAAFIATLPVRRIHGIGPVTAGRMQALGIATGADLAAQSLSFLRSHFGSMADYYSGAARGIDHRPVRAREAAKSISVEDTFGEDIADPALLHGELARIGERLWPRIAASGMRGRTVTLKIKFGDFAIITRSRTVAAGVRDAAGLMQIGHALLDEAQPLRMGARLLGLGLHNLRPAEALTHDGAGDGPAIPAQLALAI